MTQSTEDDDLTRELAAGGEAAERLVAHLVQMGASSCEIPVTRDGVEFRVTVARA